MPKKPKHDLSPPAALPPPEKNGKGIVLTSAPKAPLVVAVDDDEWKRRVRTYRKDATIADALALANHPRFKIDQDASTAELKGYLLFAQRNKAEARKVRVETLEETLDTLHKMLQYKDRAGSFQLELVGARAQLATLYDACSTDLSLRKSVMGLRTVGDRGAVIEQVLRKIRKRLNVFDTLIEMCDLVTKSLRQTYDGIHLQVEIVKLIVYKRPDGAAQLQVGTTSRGTQVRVHHKEHER